MTTAYSTLMGLALPVQGELSGTWGDTVNKGITDYVDIALAGTQTISGSQTAVTLSLTNGDASATNIAQAGSGATGTAQFAIINCTGNPAGLLTVTVPASSRQYVVINATSTSQSVKIVGAGPTTGVTIVSGEKAHIAWNGSDYVKVASSLVSQLSGTLGVANGGTGGTTQSAARTGLGATTLGGNLFTITDPSAVTFPRFNADNTVSALNAADFRTAIGAGSGTGDVVGPASATDSALVAFDGTTGKLIKQAATVTVAQGGTGATSLTGILKGNGTSAFTAATAGTDFVAPGTATTFTATQTFNGSSTTIAAVLKNAAESSTVSATAATGTINFDVLTQSVLYYTTNASGNWTLNVRGSSGTSLNTLMSTGQSVTIAFLVTNGATAYYQSAFQIDGSSVTPKWQGGTAPTAGNASSIDAYVITIIKTGAATFTALASQTRFA